MNDQRQPSVFREFQQQFNAEGGQSPTEAEDAFMRRIAPRVAGMARRQLTNDVRRVFDTCDITSTVMRRVVSCVRSGTLALQTERQFMKMLSLMTKHAIIDKHDYLCSLIRDQSRNVSVDGRGGEMRPSGSTSWDLTEADDVRCAHTASRDASPIDIVMLAEKTRALNELCSAVRKHIGNRDDWEIFRMRFLEEFPWGVIAERLEVLDDSGRPSGDVVRMRMSRQLTRLRPKLREYEQWLSERPNESSRGHSGQGSIKS